MMMKLTPSCRSPETVFNLSLFLFLHQYQPERTLKPFKSIAKKIGKFLDNQYKDQKIGIFCFSVKTWTKKCLK